LSRLKKYFTSFSAHTPWDLIFSGSASLSFYFALSLSPLLLLAFAFVGKWRPQLENFLLENLKGTFSTTDFGHMENFFKIVDKADYSGFPGALSVAFLFFSYVSFVLHCRQIFDLVICNEQEKEKCPSFRFTPSHLLSLVLLSLMVFALMGITVSLSYALSLFVKILGYQISVLEFLFSFFLKIFFFTSVARLVPTQKVKQRDALHFGVYAAVLYSLGNILMKLYFTQLLNGSALEISGSLMVILTWFYYSSFTTLMSFRLSLWQKHYAR
jgi:uncharacterized BrkB/YihY/UPF0761 family membrane protein